MSYRVVLADGAASDLEELEVYVAEHDSPRKAVALIDKVEAVINSLKDSPERGTCPREFAALGIRDFRQVYFKPYRIIYQIIGKRVYILLIVDGRRDMQSLLKRCLFEAD